MIFFRNLLLLCVTLLMLPLVLLFALLCGIACELEVRYESMWSINRHLSAIIADIMH